MAYRFKLKEPLRDGVRRIALEQLDKAIVRPKGEAERVPWVHETRKSLKRTRALLRLVRAGLEAETWQRENGALRLIARHLSPMRDRDVLGQTMARLAATSAPDVVEACRWLEAELARSPPEHAPPRGRAAGAAVTQAIQALRKARDRLAKLEVGGELVDVVAAGLARTQRAGAAAMALLETDPTDETLHELRKVVQAYQRQQGLTQAAWPALHSVRVEAARGLAQLLGEAQDLAVLAAAARVHRDGVGKGAVERIVKACRARQAALRDEALPQAARLFAMRPKAAAVELGQCWLAAMHLAAASSERQRAPDPADGAAAAARRPA